jgi:hypothetical protein
MTKAQLSKLRLKNKSVCHNYSKTAQQISDKNILCITWT